MPRKPIGKPLTLFPIRVDEDVKAAILALKDSHETINEGLRSVLLNERDLANDSRFVVPKTVQEAQAELDAAITTFRKSERFFKPFKGPLLKPSAKKAKT